MTLTLSVIIWWLVIGLVVGAIGHLLVPGRQRIGILLTIVFGIVGAVVGGIVTTAIIGTGHTVITFIVAIILAALLISAVSHPRSRLYYRSRRRIRR
jgi:uncharacterized membrane protein YeaQ/YmgE (transglycosylase-associated protein family)